MKTFEQFQKEIFVNVNKSVLISEKEFKQIQADAIQYAVQQDKETALAKAKELEGE